MHGDLQCEARRRDSLRRPSNHLPGRAVNDIQPNTNQKQSASASAFFRRTHVPSLEPLHHSLGGAVTRSIHACVCAACLVHYMELLLPHAYNIQREPGRLHAGERPVEVFALAVAVSTDTCPLDLLDLLLD